MRAAIFFILMVLLSCKDNNKKPKPVIVGMDEGVDSIVTDKIPLVQHDTIYMDSALSKGGALSHDSAYKTSATPGLPGMPAFRDVVALKQFVSKIKQLVASGEKIAVGNYIQYPLTNKIRVVKDFYRNYDKLFTPGVKEALAKTNVDQLPRNQQSVMIANGKILIAKRGNDFKIIRINN